MAERLTHRGRRTYNNRSNQKMIKRTPGNKLVYVRRKKSPIVAKCAECKMKLHGIVAKRGRELQSLPKCQRTVARMYGGYLCSKCLSLRIIDSFLTEEEKVLESKNVAELK
ncbi:hypothetical protein H311_00284 [Anncaliia algerae PRA109]|uniref:Ribosomal protein L34e n=2 Tax=Anncaliia algerae TaxID=723287 RepID=A0A059EZS2_9MICR|nr:hypothetical protein H311_00284 [Anncaliia algerae PRA109]KCZ80415.1 hypothetical protein H312_02183 [Anncaliia algerae PRA339]CBH28884.1 large subunit ribosomal protein L34 [Anncaliia algerae]